MLDRILAAIRHLSRVPMKTIIVILSILLIAAALWVDLNVEELE